MKMLERAFGMLALGILVGIAGLYLASSVVDTYYQRTVTDRLTAINASLADLSGSLATDVKGCFTATQQQVNLSQQIIAEAKGLSDLAQLGLEFEAARPLSNVDLEETYSNDFALFDLIQTQVTQTNQWLQSIVGKTSCGTRSTAPAPVVARLKAGMQQVFLQKAGHTSGFFCMSSLGISTGRTWYT